MDAKSRAHSFGRVSESFLSGNVLCRYLWMVIPPVFGGPRFQVPGRLYLDRLLGTIVQAGKTAEAFDLFLPYGPFVDYRYLLGQAHSFAQPTARTFGIGIEPEPALCQFAKWSEIWPKEINNGHKGLEEGWGRRCAFEILCPIHFLSCDDFLDRIEPFLHFEFQLGYLFLRYVIRILLHEWGAATGHRQDKVGIELPPFFLQELVDLVKRVARCPTSRRDGKDVLGSRQVQLADEPIHEFRC